MTPLLYSNILGEGKPLLILHGFLGMSDNWKTLGAQYAEEGFQVHMPDLRNHGRSFWSPEFDYGQMVADLRYYLNHHGLPSCSLIGHSMGGKAAMNLACNSPRLVEKLLIADMSPRYYPPHHGALLDALKALPLPELNSRQQADEALAARIPETGTRQFLLKSLYRNDGNFSFRFNLPVLSQTMEEMGQAIPDTDRFEGPVLFLMGEHSNYILPEDTLLIKKHFPHARIDTIPGAGHWVHAENPSAFFRKSLEFMKS